MAEDGIMGFKFRSIEDTDRDATASRDVAALTEQFLFSSAFDPLGGDAAETREPVQEDPGTLDSFEYVDGFDFIL